MLSTFFRASSIVFANCRHTTNAHKVVHVAYSEKLLDYFQNPRCVGEIPNATGVAEVSNPVCGDVMKLWVRVEDGLIMEAKFKAQGCSAAIATSSFATEMLIGRNIEDARKITREEIAEALGGLPPSKIHCSVLAVDAIQKVLK
jgi:nitrogen fixation NifU-like protein